MNIRSLNANHSKIFQFIAALNFPFDVIILSEIWTYNISLYSNLFQDYNFYYSLPANSSIGGVGAFIHNSFTVTERKDITFAPPSQGLAEIIFLQISKLNFQCLIGGVYRHPGSNMSTFTTNLELLMQSPALSRYKFDCLLTGDFNVDLLKFESHPEVSRFLDILINYNFMPASILPTRITDTSSTLIDHLYYRSNAINPSLILQNALNGCLVTDITDHLANFLVLPLPMIKTIIPDRPLIRIFSKTNKDYFLNELNSCDWATLVYNNSDVDIAFNNFSSTLQLSYEKCFPLTRLSRKRSKDKKWVTPGILKCINHKNSLYKKWIISKNTIDKEQYKAYLTVFNRTIKVAQSSYYLRTFDKSTNSIKSLWKEINKLCCSHNTSATSNITKLNVDGSIVSDSNLMADGLNKYFCNIGSKLVSQLPTTCDGLDFKEYLPLPLPIPSSVIIYYLARFMPRY